MALMPNEFASSIVVNMLDVTRLRVLVAVARHGSVTAAARELNYAQSFLIYGSALVAAFAAALLAYFGVVAITGNKTAKAVGQTPDSPTRAIQVARSQKPSLPQPQDAPADPNAPTPLVPIATIQIPKIGLSDTVYEGVTLTVIDHGPGHWPGTAMPGQWGNVVIAGHRVTHSHPFRNIDQLGAGDEIILQTNTTRYVYKMTENMIVTPDHTQIVNQHPAYEVTLFACHPPGSAKYRYVVRGVLDHSEPV